MLTYKSHWFDDHPRLRTVAVYTPTRQYGGLDVTVAGLLRQDLPPDCRMLWLLADDLYDQRRRLPELVELNRTVPVVHWKTETKPGYFRNLCAANNEAIRLARQHNADMLISLQDYIWIPHDGVRRFLWLAEAFEAPSLLTGLCHLPCDPPPDAVADPTGLYTIFATPYTARPRFGHPLDWHDCRNDRRGPYIETPMRWETNWGAIPRQALYDERLAFDEEFDRAVAFENQDYCGAAMKLGYHPVVDTGNVSFGLPHKYYWPAQWDAERPKTLTNQLLLAKKNKERGL